MFAVFVITEDSLKKKALKSVKNFVGRGKSRRETTQDERDKMLNEALKRLNGSKSMMKILTIQFSSPSIAASAIPLLENIGCRNLQVWMKHRVNKVSKSKKSGSAIRSVLVWQPYVARAQAVLEAAEL